MTLEKERNDKNKFLNLLAANSFLFFNASCADKIVDDAWSLFDEIETPFPFYCSNLFTDVNPSTGLPNAYFGSAPLTISFYFVC